MLLVVEEASTVLGIVVESVVPLVECSATVTVALFEPHAHITTDVSEYEVVAGALMMMAIWLLVPNSWLLETQTFEHTTAPLFVLSSKFVCPCTQLHSPRRRRTI